MAASRKQVLIIEREIGPIVSLRFWLEQAGIEPTVVNTTREAIELLSLGYPFTGILVQGWTAVEQEGTPSIQNTVDFLKFLESRQYPGKVYVLSTTAADNPVFRQASRHVLTDVFEKQPILNGDFMPEF